MCNDILWIQVAEARTHESEIRIDKPNEHAHRMIIHRVEDIYRRLPPDLQGYIARFLPLWQRHGLSAPPAVRPTTKALHHYYRVIRRTPPDVQWCARTRHFRYCALPGAEWRAFLDFWNHEHTVEHWKVQLWITHTVHATIDAHRTLTERLHEHYHHHRCASNAVFQHVRTCGSVDPGRVTRWAAFEVHLQVRRATPVSPPTRQACADAVCAHMVHLAEEHQRIMQG